MSSLPKIPVPDADEMGILPNESTTALWALVERLDTLIGILELKSVPGDVRGIDLSNILAARTLRGGE